MNHSDLFEAIPYAKVSFESPPSSKVGTASPNLNAKYDDWVVKMRNWTILNTPESKIDISTTQRTKASGLDKFRKISKNSFQGQSRKFSRIDSFKRNPSGVKGNFMSKLRTIKQENSATLENDWSRRANALGNDDEILFFNDDVQEIYGSDCDII